MASLEQEIETVREQLDRQVRLKSRLERMKAQQAKLELGSRAAERTLASGRTGY